MLKHSIVQYALVRTSTSQHSLSLFTEVCKMRLCFEIMTSLFKRQHKIYHSEWLPLV